MKVIGKQRNSRMCFICGLDNPYGVRAHFYNMEDGSVQTLFKFHEYHQSYPQRVHGGVLSAMLDELGCRGLWVTEPEVLAVTTTLETKYRKPVPYDVTLKGKGVVIKNTPRSIETMAYIMDLEDNVLVEASIRYLKMPVEKIATGVTLHEEMCYYIEDDVKEI